MICVRCAPGYAPERLYALDTILGEFLGLDFRVVIEKRPDWHISLDDAPEAGAVRIPDLLFSTPIRDWLTPAAMPQEPITWCILPGEYSSGFTRQALPVLYGLPSQTACQAEGNEVRLAIDVFGSSFFMLTRFEECVFSLQYPNGRYQANAALAYRWEFLDRPVVNEYVELLWSVMSRLWPRLRRRARHYSVHPSHDVDYPFAGAGQTLRGVVRSALGDALRRHDAGLAIRRLVAKFAGPAAATQLDPFWTFNRIMDSSEAHQHTSTFNFLIDEAMFSIENPLIIELMRQIRRRGHRIGVHPKLDTHTRPEGVLQAKRAIERALRLAGVGQDELGGRQHFLQWTCPDTWEAYAAAGLAYDSSLSFFDHAGFRCGTCYDYPVFNLQSRRQLPLIERPLIVMETSLFRYEKLGAEAATRRIDHLKAQCRKYQGNFTILWHNSKLYSGTHRAIYERAIS